METVFLKLVDLSMTAGWLILAILLVRLIFRRAPRWAFCLLWGLVALRLILPFSVERSFDLFPWAASSAQAMPVSLQSGAAVADAVFRPFLSGAVSPSADGGIHPAWVLSCVWLVGAVGMVTYAVATSLRLKHDLMTATVLRPGIRQSERVDSPFVGGIVHPTVYLPYDLPAADLDYVIAHEQAHIRRRDHWWKPLGFLVLSVYWFHPLVWIAYRCLCRDIEAACDEEVIRDMERDGRRAYSAALLHCSIRPRGKSVCPLAFGEIGVKARISRVMRYQKPARWLLAAVGAIGIALTVGCFTRPATSLDADLRLAIEQQVVAYYQGEGTLIHGDHSAFDYAHCTSCQVLGTEQNGADTTVYLWVTYYEYAMTNGELSIVCGSGTPTAITLNRENGEYRLVEYWQPRDGTFYPVDVENKFPEELHRQVFERLPYHTDLAEDCERMAREYFTTRAEKYPICIRT